MMNLRLPSLALLFLGLAWTPSCLSTEAIAQNDNPELSKQPEQTRLAPEFRKLLTDSLTATAQMPLNPHIKTRGRLEESILRAAIDMGDLPFAIDHVDRMVNWRSGIIEAELALAYARQGLTEQAEEHRIRAARVAANPGDRTEQTWRVDRIENRLVQLEAILNQENPQEVAAAVLSDEEFVAFTENVKAVIEAGDLDQIQAALFGCVSLHADYYQNEDRRQQCQELIRLANSRIPLQLQAKHLLQIAEHAQENQDPASALSFLDEVLELLTMAPLDIRNALPLQASAVSLRFRAGQKEKAKREADALREAYRNHYHLIADIFRCETLLPLAEAYLNIGEKDLADEIYQQALQDGLHNPNSRPRLEDITLLSLSLVRQGHHPSEELTTQIEAAIEALDNPW